MAALPAAIVVDRQPRKLHALGGLPAGALADSRIAAQLLIERVTGWPDLAAVLNEHALWLAQTGGKDALQETGILEFSKRVTYRANSPVACQIARQLLNGHGGLRYADQRQNVWYVRGSSPYDENAASVAISFDHDGLTLFRPYNVGLVATKSTEVLDVVRGQNTIAAIELLIWLCGRRPELRPIGFSISPEELLDAIARRRPESRAELVADVNDILSVLRQIRVGRMYLPPNRWQFAISNQAQAAQACWDRNRVSIQPSELLPEALLGVLPDLPGAKRGAV